MKKRIKAIPFEIKEINEDDRSFLAVASTEDLDRDNDRIMASGWDLSEFVKNPVVPWAHKYGDPPVARAEDVHVEAGRLMFRPRFASAEEYPFADTIFKLYKGGFLKAFSVGFKPKRWERVERQGKGSGYDYLETELWEISACTVPSNPNALVAAKSAGVISEEELERIEEDPLDKALAIEARLDEMEKFADEIRNQPYKWIERAIKEKRLSERLDDIESMLAEIRSAVIREPELQAESAAETPETVNPESETIESKPSGLDRAQVAEIARAAADAAAAKIGAIVHATLSYHLGIVE